MISIDTETTGLWFTHGCQTFAIGIYNGEDVATITRSIDPKTRSREIEFDDTTKDVIRRSFDDGLVCMHNSQFDIEALVEAGVFNRLEPTVPEFWEKIVDTTILSHLNHNTDDRSLKKLTPKYLDIPYESEDLMNVLVNKARMFVRTRRPDWVLANEHTPQLKPAGTNPKWWKSDMWLPYHLYIEFSEKELTDYGISYHDCRDILKEYLTDDCRNTYDLAQTLLQNVIDDYGDDVPKFLTVNNQILHVIYKMKLNGTGIHKKELDDAIDTCNEWIGKLTQETERMCGVKSITDNKLRTIIFDHYGYSSEGVVQKQTGPSVDANTLITLKRNGSESKEADKFLTRIMALKKYDKKLGYLTNFKKSMLRGKVYTNYHIVGTNTLRMSAKNPPLQTVSKATNPFEDEFDDITELLEQSPPLRSVFGPSENGRWWLCNDYSQLQLRIFAVVTDEQDMIKAFERGWDAHDYTARRIFNLSDLIKPSSGQRRIAKNVNFGFIFGASPKKIELTSGMPGLWDTVCEMFPNAHDFIQYQKELLKKGQPVRTLGGYPLDVPMKESKWGGGPAKAAHAAVCFIVQGSEGEIVKKAMRDCDDYLTSDYPAGYLTVQVHDEVIFDMPSRFPKKHAVKLRKLMEEAALSYGVVAPVNSEVCVHSWNKGKELIL